MVLRSIGGDGFVLVPPTARIGRDPDCAVRLVSSQASGTHAELRWRVGGWDLRDKGSRNGTTVDGVRIQGGIPAIVSTGATLRFGDEVWTVVDDGPPETGLFDPRTGAFERPARDRLGPLLREDDGWRLAADLVPHGTLVDGRILFVPDPPLPDATAPARITLPQARVRIVAWPGLVGIDVHVEQGAERISFAERAWAITLFVLAEARIAEPDDGWMEVDRLARRAGLARKVLDIYVRRARDAFVLAGIAAGDEIVEVRRGSRRLGIRDVVVDVRS
jgi:hypothetical protein